MTLSWWWVLLFFLLSCIFDHTCSEDRYHKPNGCTTKDENHGGEVPDTDKINSERKLQEPVVKVQAPPALRLLIVLTTYSAGRGKVKALRLNYFNRFQDDESIMIHVTSDITDSIADGVIDYLYGDNKHHRLLPAIMQANATYSGSYDFMLLGDDDTFFALRRLKRELAAVDSSLPLYFGMVDGACTSVTRPPLPYGLCERWCFHYAKDGMHEELPPKEFNANGQPKRYRVFCCNRDWRKPCHAPAELQLLNGDYANDIIEGIAKDEKLGMAWGYGGAGIIVSAGLLNSISKQDWMTCMAAFPGLLTDISLAWCLRVHGYTISYHPGCLRETNLITLRRRLCSRRNIISAHVSHRHNALDIPMNMSNGAAVLWEGMSVQERTFADVIATLNACEGEQEQAA